VQLEVTRELVRTLEAGERCALATLVDAHGSTPQKVGARLLVRADGSMAGTLGGGCIEAEAWEAATDALASGRPRLLDFELTEDIAVDYGLACGGTERIDIDPAWCADDLPLARALQRAAEGEGRAVVLRVIEPAEAGRLAVFAGGAVLGDLGARQDAALRVARNFLDAPRPRPSVVRLPDGATAFADVFAEPPEVVIVGGGHVGRAVATVASFLGYRIAVIDDRKDFASSDRFPEADAVIAGDIGEAIAQYPMRRNSAVVIVTRGHKYDYEALAAAARSDAGYVGLMGSRRKVALIYRQLLRDGIPESRLRDIHAPIGLDIGAVSPEEIAVSIMAEVTMDRLGGDGGPMSAERLVERVARIDAAR